jgi:hypothetical protein
MLMYALGGMVAGYVSIESGIQIILTALGLGALRSGIAKTEVDQVVTAPPQ